MIYVSMLLGLIKQFLNWRDRQGYIIHSYDLKFGFALLIPSYLAVRSLSTFPFMHIKGLPKYYYCTHSIGVARKKTSSNWNYNIRSVPKQNDSHSVIGCIQKKNCYRSAQWWNNCLTYVKQWNDNKEFRITLAYIESYYREMDFIARSSSILRGS